MPNIIPKKILFLVHKLNVGGAEQRLYDLLKYEQYNETFSFKIACLHERGIIGQELSKLGFQVETIKTNNKIIRLLKLVLLLKKERPDIIHIHLWPARRYTILFKLFSRASILYSLDSQLNDYSRRMKYAEKLFYYLTDKIIAVSNSAKNTYCKKIGVKGNRIKVIYNGVDVERFRCSNNGTFRKELNFSNDHTIITTIARLSERKGHIYLLRAARILKDKFQNLRFVIVGDGDYKQTIVNEIKKLEIEDLVTLTGYRTDINNILGSTDIFAFPSYTEAQGIAIIEAMLAGVPVVTNDCEGINEVANKSNSIIVQPKNPFELAKGLELLIQDKQKRTWLAKEARDYALKNFSLALMCERYKRVYQNLNG